MSKTAFSIVASLLLTALFVSCKSSIKEQEDKIYSRHLQRHVDLRVITTPMPDNKEEMNLLIWINGQDLEALEVKKITDSLCRKKLIQPLTIVGVDGDAGKEYGLSGLDGNKADKFMQFVDRELYPFAKKKVVIRKFRSVAIAGCNLAAISALDIAWNNADKISKLGLFAPDFSYAGITDSSNIALSYLKASRKRPRFETWLYSPAAGTAAGNNAQMLNTIMNDKKIISNSSQFSFSPNNNVSPVELRNQVASFLLWAFAK